MFVVIEQDRHADTEVTLFNDRDAAIAYAERAARDACRHEENLDLSYELTKGMQLSGWLRYIPYSVEGDNVRVVERKVEDA